MTIADGIQIALLVITAVGIVLGFIVTNRELVQSRKIAQGEFLLHLDELFREHQQIHINLRPGGAWSTSQGAPRSAEEWAALEAYMGLIERIKVLIDDGIIDLKTFKRLYGYRVNNVVQNETIRHEKLEGMRADYWQDFIALRTALDAISP